MKSFAEAGLFNGIETLALYTAQKAVDAVIEPEGVRYRCHEIARAVAAQTHVWGVVEDGNCGGADHSWIRLSTGNILDPYVCWRLPMVQLVDVRSPTLQRDLYRVEAERTDIDEDLVAKLSAEMSRFCSGQIIEVPGEGERLIMDPSGMGGVMVAGLSSIETNPRRLSDLIQPFTLTSRHQFECEECEFISTFDLEAGQEISGLLCLRCGGKLGKPLRAERSTT